MRPKPLSSLWITGLADRLPLYDTVEEALVAGASGGEQAGGAAAEGIKSA